VIRLTKLQDWTPFRRLTTAGTAYRIEVASAQIGPDFAPSVFRPQIEDPLGLAERALDLAGLDHHDLCGHADP
jgi:hypothetical protein